MIAEFKDEVLKLDVAVWNGEKKAYLLRFTGVPEKPETRLSFYFTAEDLVRLGKVIEKAKVLAKTAEGKESKDGLRIVGAKGEGTRS